MTDDWDERVDAVSRGLLAMTVACARCHDHKFDADPDQGLLRAGRACSPRRMRAERPLFDVDPQDRDALSVDRRTGCSICVIRPNLLTNEASTVVGSAERVAKWKAEIEALKAEMQQTRGTDIRSWSRAVKKYWTLAPPKPAARKGAVANVKADPAARSASAIGT